MSKTSMVVVAVVVVILAVGGAAGVHVVDVANQEVRIRNAVLSKQRDNESEYDALWKKIEQAAQVSADEKKALVDIFVAHAEARGGSDQAIAGWLTESVPRVDTTTYRNLQNVIAGSRDRFAMRQRELLDLKRRHDVLMESFPAGPVLGMLGRPRVEVTVITSARTEEVFASGRDERLELPTTE